MDAQRWAKVSVLLDELLELDLGERESRLNTLASSEPELAGELQHLLALDAQRADFLRDPLPLDSAATASARCNPARALVRIT